VDGEVREGGAGKVNRSQAGAGGRKVQGRRNLRLHRLLSTHELRAPHS
jgi:hypothetical protein